MCTHGNRWETAGLAGGQVRAGHPLPRAAVYHRVHRRPYLNVGGQNSKTDFCIFSEDDLSKLMFEENNARKKNEKNKRLAKKKTGNDERFTLSAERSKLSGVSH